MVELDRGKVTFTTGIFSVKSQKSDKFRPNEKKYISISNVTISLFWALVFAKCISVTCSACHNTEIYAI